MDAKVIQVYLFPRALLTIHKVDKNQESDYSQADGRHELFDKRGRVQLGVAAEKSSSAKNHIVKPKSKKNKVDVAGVMYCRPLASQGMQP